MLRAVIFDLDGTLTDFDSELAKRTVSKELAALTGRTYQDIRRKLDSVHYTFNIKSIYDRNVWWEQFDPELPSKEKQRLTNLYWHCVIDTTAVKPHVEELLKALKEKGLLLALLTDFDGESFSKRDRVNLLPLVAYFDLVVISGEDTRETKPSSEPYQYILDSLNVSPQHVLMVGDKPEVDLEGAHALGMKTLLLVGDYGDAWAHTVRDVPGILTYVEALL